MNNWKPIDSAPKDGTNVLSWVRLKIAHQDWVASQVRWLDSRTRQSHNGIWHRNICVTN